MMADGSRDPLVDMRDDEDARENYLDGRTNHRPPATPRVAEEHNPVIGRAGYCWCGKEFGHDWPGRADGASHPR